MGNAFLETYAVLRDYGIKDVASLHMLDPKSGRQGKNSYNVRKELYESILKTSDQVNRILDASKGVKLCVALNNNSSINRDVIMKSLVYGEKIVLVSKEFRKTRVKKGKDTDKFKKKETYFEDYEYALDLRLIEVLLRYKTIVDADVLFVQPEGYKLITNNNTLRQPGNNELRVKLEHKGVFDHVLKEEPKGNLRRLALASLKIPTLKTDKVSHVLELRQEKAKAFSKFQTRLNELLKTSRVSGGDEGRLAHLIAETHESVKLLQDDVQDFYKRNIPRLGVAVLGSAVGCACIVAPDHLSQGMQVLLGNAPLFATVSMLTDMKNDYRNLEANAFYFPWHINSKYSNII